MDNRRLVNEALTKAKLQFDVVETPVYKFVIKCCKRNRGIDLVEIYPDITNAANHYLVCFVLRNWGTDATFLSVETLLEEVIALGAPRINSTHINKLELSVRTYNALTREDIYYVEDIIPLFENGSILEIRNLGKKSVAELCDVLNKIGFEVKNPFDEKKRSSETEEIINKLATKMNVSPDEVSSMLDDLNVQGFRRKKVKEG